MSEEAARRPEGCRREMPAQCGVVGYAGSGPGRGGGGGRGRFRGGGGGRRYRCRARGGVYANAELRVPEVTREQQVESLRHRAECLDEAREDLGRRIRELETPDGSEKDA